MGRKHNIKDIHLQIDNIEGFCNDDRTGFIISWSSDIGFGEYAVWKDCSDNDFKLYANSECMDSNDDKEFVAELMRLVINKLIITG